MRVGHGLVRVQRCQGDKFLLGGVVITAGFGSPVRVDGDFLATAVADALLGAAGEGSLTSVFDTESPSYRSADSRTLLRLVNARLASRGLRPNNLDVSLQLEGVGWQRHHRQIISNLAEDLQLTPEHINLKSAVSIGLGDERHNELLALASVLLSEES